MLKLFILLILTLKYVTLSEVKYCDGHLGPLNCFYNGTNCKIFNISDFSWFLKDVDNGISEVMFPVGCQHFLYNFVIYVNESLDESECSLVDSTLLNKVYTNIHYEILEPGESSKTVPCHENISIDFNHLISGCYLMKINVENLTKTGSILLPGFELKKYFKTNYVRVKNVDPKVIIETRYHDSTLNVHFEHPFLKHLEYVEIDLKFGKYNQKLNYAVRRPQGDDSIIAPGRYKLDVCRLMHPYDPQDTFNITDPTCQYLNITTSAIDCIYNIIVYDVYEFTFDIFDTRCSSEVCTWNTKKNVAEPIVYDESIVRETLSDEDIPIEAKIFIAIVIVIVFSCLALALFCLLRKKANSFPIIRELDEGTPMNSKKILLLYARDCQVFMDLMDAYKTVLSIEGKFEVCDIYDPARYNEIASNPEVWIRDKIQNCKIILILTKCADIQNSQKVNPLTLYQQPQSFDNYFLAAVTYINQDSTDNSKAFAYDKNFLVTLNFDKSDYKSFDFINPYTRYQIPTNFSEIIRDIRGDIITVANEEQHTEIEQTCAYRKFIEKFTEYENYCKKKPQYLEEILNIQYGNSV